MPDIVVARAMTGDLKGAHDLIDTTPADCYRCMIARGRIRAVEHLWGRADYWFSRAAASGTRLPFAYEEWGEALLNKRDYDGAIEKFRIANARSPHFADPPGKWGEALIAQNRSDLAVEKFAEAAKDAPNWGRLHLKWGEALTRLGKTDEAKKQLELAETLD